LLAGIRREKIVFFFGKKWNEILFFGTIMVSESFPAGVLDRLRTRCDLVHPTPPRSIS
jgi:hypothetical protein